MLRNLKYVVPTVGSMLLSTPVLANAEEQDCDVPPAPPKPKCKKACRKEDKRTELEKCIDTCRKECGPLKNAFTEYTKDLVEMGSNVGGAIAENVRYLQNCADPEVQYTAVGAGGVLGIMFSFHKSALRKSLYGLTGTALMYGVVFPKDALCYTKQGLGMVKKYGEEGYNLLTGNRCPTECPKKKCLDCPAERLKKKCHKDLSCASECPKKKTELECIIVCPKKKPQKDLDCVASVPAAPAYQPPPELDCAPPAPIEYQPPAELDCAPPAPIEYQKELEPLPASADMECASDK